MRCPAHAPRIHAGRYENPVLYADYSDPDVVRVGDRWYMTASSFANAPGLPVLESADLVTWHLVGTALAALPPFDHYRTPRRGGGVWAPAIRHVGGKFQITYPDPDWGIFQIEAVDPAGPWSAPVKIDASRGAIDPCPFTDDDGSRWLIKGWAKSRSGFNNRLTLHRLGPDGTVVDEGTTVVDGFSLPPVETSAGPRPWVTIEGPKLYKRGGWYYIFAPAGGVKVGWQAVFRAPSLAGPWEARNVLDQGSTAVNGPHQGALVDDPDGRWWFFHFQDQDSWGRVVHLQPVAWVDDWPVIGRPVPGTLRGEPVADAPLPYPVAALAPSPPAPGRPGLEWQWQANPGDRWLGSGGPADGWRLTAVPQPARPWDNGALLTRKLEGPACELTVWVTVDGLKDGEEAGVVALGSESLTLTLAPGPDGGRLTFRAWSASPEPSTVVVRAALPLTVGLRLVVTPVVVGPDRLARTQAHWSADGTTWTPVGSAVDLPPGRWVGTQVGVFALAPAGTPAYAATSNGWADFTRFGWRVFEGENHGLHQ